LNYTRGDRKTICTSPRNRTTGALPLFSACETLHMARFVVAHGAWSAGWAWKKMHPLMAAAGHEMFTPTWTGIGERRHLASEQVNLSTHIADLVQHMETEDHSDVVLLAHSYGGMVATGAMAHIGDRVRQVIYLDAVVPERGQSMLDTADPAVRDALMQRVAESGSTPWLVPSNPMPPDTPEEDLEWIASRRVEQPLSTFTEPCPFGATEITVPKAYIYCLKIGPGDMFGRFATQAQASPDWVYREIDASHSPNITAPSELLEMLVGLLV
jgi:pimeloyl-ACP methyl ester carboxylesterase